MFCVDCGHHTGLTGASRDQRVCPACHTHLSRPDDVTLANLNPSEDYKTSVLSGLSPEAIMECAGRGLSFWSYQMAQDLFVTPRCPDVVDIRTRTILIKNGFPGPGKATIAEP